MVIAKGKLVGTLYLNIDSYICIMNFVAKGEDAKMLQIRPHE